MKIWKSFAGEHSSNLKIIAKFKSVSDAKKSEKLFNSLLEISTNTSLTLNDIWGENELAALMRQEQCYDVCTDDDYKRLEYFAPIEAIGNTITVKMDTYDMQPVVKALLFYGASIEMFDSRVHPEKE
jgi:hypothetical protein